MSIFNRNSIFFLFVSSLLLSANPVFAEDEKDIFADYNADIRKSADAKASNVYNAWGENMANLISSGLRDGIVVDGAGSYANGKVQADGVGNINVAKGANVGTLINKTTLKNSIISNQKKW